MGRWEHLRKNLTRVQQDPATKCPSQSELKLVNVARSSLDELLLDYEDFLRQRGLRQWEKGDREAGEVRAVGGRLPNRTNPTDPSDQSDWAAYAAWLEHADPAVVANAVICLIHQANYLLDRQIAALERTFIEAGGYAELLATERLRRRNQQPANDPGPRCPLCGQAMIVRTARSGKRNGSRFWGCSAYPGCRGVRQLEDPDPAAAHQPLDQTADALARVVRVVDGQEPGALFPAPPTRISPVPRRLQVPECGSGACFEAVVGFVDA
jgi:four helix bundle suffix protein